MITETREIYTCEFCRRYYKLKHFAVEHEPKCKKNPDNYQVCLAGCQHLEKKLVTYFWDSYIGEQESTKEILFCNKKQEGVYPFWINPIEEFIIDEDEYVNYPMPNECEFYKLKGE